MSLAMQEEPEPGLAPGEKRAERGHLALQVLGEQPSLTSKPSLFQF